MALCIWLAGGGGKGRRIGRSEPHCNTDFHFLTNLLSRGQHYGRHTKFVKQTNEQTEDEQGTALRVVVSVRNQVPLLSIESTDDCNYCFSAKKKKCEVGMAACVR